MKTVTRSACTALGLAALLVSASAMAETRTLEFHASGSPTVVIPEARAYMKQQCDALGGTLVGVLTFDFNPDQSIVFRQDCEF